MACTECAIGTDFEISVTDSSILDDRIEQHVQLIRTGHCNCEHIDDASKLKVIASGF